MSCVTVIVCFFSFMFFCLWLLIFVANKTTLIRCLVLVLPSNVHLLLLFVVIHSFIRSFIQKEKKKLQTYPGDDFNFRVSNFRFIRISTNNNFIRFHQDSTLILMYVDCSSMNCYTYRCFVVSTCHSTVLTSISMEF